MYKNRFLQGLLESTKKIGDSHTFFFEIISLEYQQHFLEQKGKSTSSHISLEFAFTHRNASTFIKILKLHDKW